MTSVPEQRHPNLVRTALIDGHGAPEILIENSKTLSLESKTEKRHNNVIGMYIVKCFETDAEEQDYRTVIRLRSLHSTQKKSPRLVVFEKFAFSIIQTSLKVVASWSSGRHLVLGSGGPGFKSWLCQFDVESLGKALYMHFLTPLMCTNEYPTIDSILDGRVICNGSFSVMLPKELRKVQ